MNDMDRKAYQIYRIHLNCGKILEVVEDFHLPFEKGLIAHYEKAKDDELFTIGDELTGFTYVLRRNIAFIETGGVRT